MRIVQVLILAALVVLAPAVQGLPCVCGATPEVTADAQTVGTCCCAGDASCECPGCAHNKPVDPDDPVTGSGCICGHITQQAAPAPITLLGLQAAAAHLTDAFVAAWSHQVLSAHRTDYRPPATRPLLV